MPDINQDHVTELAVRLQKYFVNQQQVSGRLAGNIAAIIQDALNMHRARTARSLVEELGQLRFAASTVHDTAALAEQDLRELLALVGVELRTA